MEFLRAIGFKLVAVEVVDLTQDGEANPNALPNVTRSTADTFETEHSSGAGDAGVEPLC
jgi:hypothetical protein